MKFEIKEKYRELYNEDVYDDNGNYTLEYVSWLEDNLFFETEIRSNRLQRWANYLHKIVIETGAQKFIKEN